MANVYKNIQAVISSAGSDVDMYTVPDETTSIVKSIQLYNTHSGDLVVDVTVYDASSATDFEYDTVTVTTGESETLLTSSNVLILEAGDILKMQTPTTNVVKMTAAVLQTSRSQEIMPFIETKAKSEYKIIDGKKTHVITPECEVTLTNIKTGKEYMSDVEADHDVNNPNSNTKREHIRRDVHIKVAQVGLGADTGDL